MLIIVGSQKIGRHGIDLAEDASGQRRNRCGVGMPWLDSGQFPFKKKDIRE